MMDFKFVYALYTSVGQVVVRHCCVVQDIIMAQSQGFPTVKEIAAPLIYENVVISTITIPNIAVYTLHCMCIVYINHRTKAKMQRTRTGT